MKGAPIVKRSIPTNLGLDADAKALLPILSPNGNAYGKLVSELLRQEMVRRETRKETVQAILAQLQDMAAR